MKHSIGIIAAVLFLAGTAPSIQAQVSTNAEQSVFYTANSVTMTSEATMITAIRYRVTHIASVFEKRNIRISRGSYIGTHYYKALAYLAQNDLTNAATALDECERRMKERKLWDEPTHKLRTYNSTK
jgi:hypothetical protein